MEKSIGQHFARISMKIRSEKVTDKVIMYSLTKNPLLINRAEWMSGKFLDSYLGILISNICSITGFSSQVAKGFSFFFLFFF